MEELQKQLNKNPNNSINNHFKIEQEGKSFDNNNNNNNNVFFDNGLTLYQLQLESQIRRQQREQQVIHWQQQPGQHQQQQLQQQHQQQVEAFIQQHQLHQQQLAVQQLALQLIQQPHNQQSIQQLHCPQQQQQQQQQQYAPYHSNYKKQYRIAPFSHSHSHSHNDNKHLPSITEVTEQHNNNQKHENIIPAHGHIDIDCFDVSIYNTQSLFNVYKNKKGITPITNKASNCFGKFEIDSMSACIYEWKFKILGNKKQMGGTSVVIGIYGSQNSAKYSSTDWSKSFYKCKNSLFVAYGYDIGRGLTAKSWVSATKYVRRPIHDGDIITMRLDLLNKCVSYKHNNHDLGRCEKHIRTKANLCYRMAIKFGGNCKGRSVEIQRFQVITAHKADINQCVAPESKYNELEIWNINNECNERKSHANDSPSNLISAENGENAKSLNCNSPIKQPTKPPLRKCHDPLPDLSEFNGKEDNSFPGSQSEPGSKRTYSYTLPDKEPFCVWLGNLPTAANSADILKYLEAFNIYSVRSVRFGESHKDSYTCAYVDFYNKQDMKTALQSIDCMTAPLFMDRQLEIDINEGMDDRETALVACESLSCSQDNNIENENEMPSDDDDELDDLREVIIKPLKGNVMTLLAKAKETILSIKLNIELQNGTPPKQQRLIFGNKELSDDCLLSQFGVGNELILYLLTIANNVEADTNDNCNNCDEKRIEWDNQSNMEPDVIKMIEMDNMQKSQQMAIYNLNKEIDEIQQAAIDKTTQFETMKDELEKRIEVLENENVDIELGLLLLVEDKTKLNIHIKELEEENKSMKKLIAEKEKEKECVACLDLQRSYICLPCAHLCLCQDCVKNINNVCPLCQNKCTDIVKVFK